MTPTFVPIQRDLSLLYRPFAEKVPKVLSQAKTAGLVVKPFETLRTVARQEYCVAVKASTVSFSNHMLGLSVDIYPVDSKGFMGGKFLDAWKGWDKLADIYEDNGLVAGRRWKSFVDNPHGEYLFGVKKNILSQIYWTKGLQAVWKYIDAYKAAV